MESGLAAKKEAHLNQVYLGDNLPILQRMPPDSVDLIYIDPPFNTGKIQAKTRLRTVRDPQGDRTGFQGLRYRTERGDTTSYADAFDDYLAFLEPRLREGYRVLKPTGAFYFHIDYREVHYCKVLLDGIFGRECFLNEIIWAYDYGGRSRKRWPAKHDNILLYVKDPEHYTFNVDEIDRIPYMAPGLAGPEKTAEGKLPTDTWWHTIVPPGGKESTGYATQKPLAVLKRIVTASSNPGDMVLDFFAGSGTTGVAAAELGRQFILIDSNKEAMDVMKQRLARYKPEITMVPSTTAEFASIPSTPLSERVHVIIAAVWDYEDSALKRLRGPAKDVAMVRQLFSKDSKMGMFPQTQIKVLENPTFEDLNAVFTNYVLDCSAIGNILIFYFSGHGTTLGNNQFGFCLKNTRFRQDDGCIQSSALNFDVIFRTLTDAHVYPVFIIDACNSGKAGQFDPTTLIDGMDKQIQSTGVTSFGLLCACGPEGLAEDTANGGAFTKSLFEAASTGLTDKTHRGQQYLKLSDLVKPIQDRFEIAGLPLPKLHLGQNLPEFPLVRNVAYQPSSLTLTSLRQILGLLWNDGHPRSVIPTDILKECGPGAYANHNKLSLKPWNLVEDTEDTKHRRLTERGKQFMKGQLKVPRKIQYDPVTASWHASENAQEVGYAEMQAPKAPASKTIGRGPKPAKKR